MKKIFYLLTLSAFVFTGCNPNEDINATIDAQENVIVGDVVYTLNDDDYDDLDLTYANFSSTDQAKEMVPELLSDLFPVWGKGSSALVSYISITECLHMRQKFIHCLLENTMLLLAVLMVTSLAVVTYMST